MPTGAIFIDLTKAFDMVDHYLLLDKLYAIGLSSDSLLFNSFLHHRSQCVTFQGSQSDFKVIDKGVPQGSSLGPLLFSIFINDLPQICSDSQTHLYADDTVIYSSSTDISRIQHSLQSDFNLVQKWFSFNKLLLNKKKSYSMLFCTRPNSLPLTKNWSISFLDGTALSKVEEFKYLGLWLDTQLSFKPHINSISKKIFGQLKSLYLSADCFSQQVRKRIITQLILPLLDYADVIYGNTSESNLRPLSVLYNSLCRFVLRCPFRTHHCLMYESLNWLAPKSRRQLHWSLFIFKCINFNYPPYLKHYLIPFSSQYRLRHTDYLFFLTPRISKEIGRRAFKFKAPSDWNNLPCSLRSITSFHIFKSSLLTHLQTSCSCY